MLFEKKMDPRCSYCSRSARLDDETVMCIKKGVVPTGYHCRGFQYDPLKRVPPRPAAPDFPGSRTRTSPYRHEKREARQF